MTSVRDGADSTRDAQPPWSVSVVVPVYRSVSTLPVLVERVSAALAGRSFEIILVDDGSPRETWQMVRDLAAGHAAVRGLRLGRNAGQHSALLAGVREAQFDVVVTIDDDLQNPPEEIPTLLAALVDGVDVVYGNPVEVAQKRWRRNASVWTRGLMASALGADNAARMTSFRAFRTRLRDGFDEQLGPSVSIDALLVWSTSNFTSVPVDHHHREVGASNYNFRKLFRFAIDTATGYSALPLQIATTVGLATAVLGFLILLWVILRVIISGIAVPGFAFLASVIIIFSGVQLLTLGIIGEYLARMHFRVMRKPTYVVAERVGGNAR